MASRITQVALRAAEAQHGVVSRVQLREAGIPSSTIQNRIRGRFLFPVFDGVYLVGRKQLTLDAARMAAVLRAGDGAAIGGRSAAAVWGFLDHLSPIEVFRTGGGVNQRSGINLHGSRLRPYLIVRKCVRLPDSEVRMVRGIPVTSVARSLRDLGGLPDAKFNRAFLEADRLGLIDDDELRSATEETRGCPGGRRFRARTNARIPEIHRARSILEAIYLDLHRSGAIPLAELNVAVLGQEADLVWRDRGVVVELDGYEFHRGREAFEKDALRGNRLRADGWSVLRITWRMLLNRPDEVASLIRGVLDQNPSS